MSTEITATIPGRITSILVKVGDLVAEDEEIITLEAMKMENPVFSTSSGLIREIRVKESDVVEANQVLVVLG
jgi:acetyl-CoA carboxylase biotin carboxyl carrier protein